LALENQAKDLGDYYKSYGLYAEEKLIGTKGKTISNIK